MTETPPGNPSTEESHQAPKVLAAALLGEQRECWRRGECVLVETYLERHPALRGDADALLDLICSEMVLREEQRNPPQLEEYQARFPQVAAQLRDQFDVHRALEGGLDSAAGLTPESLSTDPGPPHFAKEGAGSKHVPGYAILRELGRGGMGIVYKAHHEKLDRLVALKMIRAGTDASPQELARFRAEAIAVAQLQHPHIIQIYEVGEHEGQPFFALEYVEGGSLADQLDGTPRSPMLAAQLVETLARSMHAAHLRDIVHRDLKPANVLLTADGAPKITDFGLAKRLDVSAEHTRSGDIVGTPSYMAPEQAKGKRRVIGPAADVYALGGILYELLTGRPPFKGETPLETLMQVIADEPVPPRRLVPKVPRDLETICLKCLAKELVQRYPTMQALAEDLRHFLNGEPIAARPVGRIERTWRWCRRKPAQAGLVTAVTLLLVGAVVGPSIGLVLVRAEQQRTQLALEAEARRRQQTRQALDLLSERVIQDWLGQQQKLLPEHRKFLEQALAYYEEFTADTAEDERSRAGIARAHQRVASIRSRLGRVAEAEAAYRQARKLHQQLTDDFPREHEHRLGLAKTCNSLGLLLAKTGRLEQAEEAYSQALQLNQQLVASFPSVAEYRRELAANHGNLGRLLQDKGRLSKAETAHGEALKLHQQLVHDFPGIPDYRKDLAQTHNNLGMVLEEMQRLDVAERGYATALRLLKQLVADFPLVAEYREALARSQSSLGNRLADQGRLPEAEAAHRDALKLQEQLVAKFPSVPAYRQDLARSHNDLGLVLAERRLGLQAEAVYLQGQKLLEQLAAEFPSVPAYRRELAGTHNNLGLLLETLGQLHKAEPAYDAALKLLKQLATEFPSLPEHQNDLAGMLGNLANLHRQRKEFALARQFLDQALPYHQAAIKLSPQNPSYRHLLRSNRWLLVSVLVKIGDHGAAAETSTLLGQDTVAQPKEIYDAACFMTQCVPLAEKDQQLPEAKRSELAQHYAVRAVALLRQAHAAGYFKDAAHVVALKKDADFAALHPRDEFQKLLADLEKR